MIKRLEKSRPISKINRTQMQMHIKILNEFTKIIFNKDGWIEIIKTTHFYHENAFSQPSPIKLIIFSQDRTIEILNLRISCWKDRLTTSITANTNSINQLETDVERVDSSLAKANFKSFTFSFCHFEFLSHWKFILKLL